MILNQSLPLSLITVLERGVPNKECICLFVSESLNMGQFGLMIGHMAVGGGGAIPVRDSLFWFGDGVVDRGDWIFVYTAGGTTRKDRNQDNSGNIYSVHWGRDKTIFANSAIVPILFRVDGINVGFVPADLPQSTKLVAP